MSTRILACTSCADDWQQFLADPEKHWRDGYSAKALATRWEGADGIPSEVTAALEGCPDGALLGSRAFLAVPEYQTDLPGGRRPSQTDLMVIGRSAGGGFAMAVEGKVDESFGPLVGEWQQDWSEGKQARWRFLCATLGLGESLSPDLRYQLFHRAASAVLAARRYHSPMAVLLVHSFSAKNTGYDDFGRFLDLFGATAAMRTVQPVTTIGKTRLYAGWVNHGGD
jgi:hypothetical protein